DGIRDKLVTGVQTCALPISKRAERIVREEVAKRIGLPDEAAERLMAADEAKPSATALAEGGGAATAAPRTTAKASPQSRVRLFRSEERRVGKEWRWREETNR